MNLEKKNQFHSKNDANYDADREAALWLMEDIPDVKPVNKVFSWILISIFVALLVLPMLFWGVLNVVPVTKDVVFGFAKTESGELIQAQMDEYIAQSKLDGSFDRFFDTEEAKAAAAVTEHYLALPLTTDAKPLREEAKAELRIGVVAEKAPYVKKDMAGIYNGIEVDILKAFCTKYGYTPSFTEATEAEHELGNGTYDVLIGGLFLSDKLEKNMSCSVYTTITPTVAELLTFDTGENRALAAFPTEFDPQTITTKIESWFNDHLPFRSVLYKTQETMINTMEKPYTETLRPALMKLFPMKQPVNPGPGNEVVENPFGTLEPETEITETETLPDFTDETDVPSDCDHSFAEVSVVVQEPTCTEYGVIGYPCEKCDYVGKKAYTAKAEHDFTSNNPIIPLCGQKYTEELTCKNCDLAEIKIIEKGHTPGKKVSRVDPSYTSYGYTLVRCKDCEGEYRTELKDKLYYTDYLPPLYHGASVTEGRNKWLFYRGDNSEAYYQGTNLLSDPELATYMNTLQTLQTLCDQKGIQLLIAVWPNKDQVYYEYMPSIEVITQNKRVERWADFINKNTDTKVIYPINELLAAKPYWEVYYQYDTHWNNAGGFIGFQAMLKALGIETTELKNLPVTMLKNSGLGDMISIGGLDSKEYTGRFNYAVDYLPEVNVLSKVGGDGANDIRHTTSDGPSDVNFVMLADSYRVMQLSYLEKQFTDCFLAHRNQVNDASVINAVLESDILVLAAVERYDYSIIQTANTLIQILSQN